MSDFAHRPLPRMTRTGVGRWASWRRRSDGGRLRAQMVYVHGTASVLQYALGMPSEQAALALAMRRRLKYPAHIFRCRLRDEPVCYLFRRHGGNRLGG